LLDFLPAAFWAHQLGDPLFGLFVEVHAFLKEVVKLSAWPGAVARTKTYAWQ